MNQIKTKVETNRQNFEINFEHDIRHFDRKAKEDVEMMFKNARYDDMS